MHDNNSKIHLNGEQMFFAVLAGIMAIIIGGSSASYFVINAITAFIDFNGGLSGNFFPNGIILMTGFCAWILVMIYVNLKVVKWFMAKFDLKPGDGQ